MLTSLHLGKLPEAKRYAELDTDVPGTDPGLVLSEALRCLGDFGGADRERRGRVEGSPSDLWHCVGSASGLGIGGSYLIGVSVMEGTVRVRTVAWFATAVVLTLLATLLASQQWKADAAPGDRQQR